MKFLGIDYGSKNIGVAVSDPEGRVAFPKEVLPNNTQTLSLVKRMCDEEGIEGVVLGESLNYENNPNPIMADIERFANALRSEVKVPVHLEPEFMTSLQAERMQGKHHKLDASAATIILQSYLDKKNSRIV